RAGSSPATSTILKVGETLNLQRFSCFILWRKMYVLVCTYQQGALFMRLDVSSVGVTRLK
ncbi:MAG: hypothetical protein J1E65_08770, partial [Lachnospiraceae bacterium]|nr:hypothetical protein [Lachnospiraceae bacterium]